MLYFGFLPIAFDASGEFKTNRLSKYWLKKFEHTMKDTRYVLSGQTPQGDSFKAFFDQAGKFLFVRIDSWSPVASNQDPWFEVYLSRTTKTITAGGAELTEEKSYQVNEATSKLSVWPKDFDSKSCPLSLLLWDKEVSDALKRQGFSYEPNEIVVKVLKEVYTSQLGAKDLFREIRFPEKENELFSKNEDPEKDIYTIMQEHKDFWENLRVH